MQRAPQKRAARWPLRSPGLADPPPTARLAGVTPSPLSDSSASELHFRRRGLVERCAPLVGGE
eukprot:scaffold70370_cov14-Prasinocladus_malaysianus.AAC.1